MGKNNEKWLFELFQSKYPAIAEAKVEYGDKPDVIITLTSEERIGIELTEAIYDEELMRASEYQIRFNEKVIELLESLMPFKFHLDIELDPKNSFRQNQLDHVIREILQFCTVEFMDLQPYEARSFKHLNVDWDKGPPALQQQFLDDGYRKIINGVSRVRMIRYDFLKKSRHPESKGGPVPDFTQEHLDAILSKKEKSLAKYRACDQQWLVIGEGGDFYSYMNHIRIEKGFPCKFDKVFICRRWEKELVVLK